MLKHFYPLLKLGEGGEKTTLKVQNNSKLCDNSSVSQRAFSHAGVAGIHEAVNEVLNKQELLPCGSSLFHMS